MMNQAVNERLAQITRSIPGQATTNARATNKLMTILSRTLRRAPYVTVKKILQNLQIKDPKTFFTVLKNLSGLTRKAKIASGFKWEPDQDPQPTIAQHIEELFGNAN